MQKPTNRRSSKSLRPEQEPSRAAGVKSAASLLFTPLSFMNELRPRGVIFFFYEWELRP